MKILLSPNSKSPEWRNREVKDELFEKSLIEEVDKDNSRSLQNWLEKSAMLIQEVSKDDSRSLQNWLVKSAILIWEVYKVIQEVHKADSGSPVI